MPRKCRLCLLPVQMRVLWTSQECALWKRRVLVLTLESSRCSWTTEPTSMAALLPHPHHCIELCRLGRGLEGLSSCSSLVVPSVQPGIEPTVPLQILHERWAWIPCPDWSE